MIHALVGLLLLGCSDATPLADTGVCASSYGVLRACAAYGTIPYEGATAFALEAGAEGPPIQTLTGADGCVDLELPAGPWVAWAASWECLSEEMQVDVATCAVTTVKLDLSAWCSGR